MSALRLRILADRRLTLWLSLLALALRLLVPTGYMPATGPHGITITLCSGMSDTAAMPMAMPGMEHGKSDPGHDPGREGTAHTPCPFASVTLPALAGGDALAAILPVVATARCIVLPPPSPAPRPGARLRPPGRAPPLLG